MRIVQLTVRDFRAFPGTFGLPLKNGCNLLLHGENGAGKSSLAAALREFLSLERSFPRPVDPFVHVFAAAADAAGVIPPRAPRVELHFDTATPPEVIAWSPGHLHPLQLNDGATPASTTEPQRELLTSVSRQSGFFDYRTVLRSSFCQGGTDLGAQLFSLFVESLLSGFRPDGGANTLREFWSRVKTAKPITRHKGPMRRAGWATDAFNAKLAPFLEQVRVEANRLLNFFPGHRLNITRLQHPGCQYSKTSKNLIGDRLDLGIEYAGRTIARHEDFLNEARLTALGLSMFLAAVKLADSNPADPVPLRVLLLDDVLIGLDLGNRIPLLDLLHQEFSNHQIFLFTHDLVWFDIAKAHTEYWGTWKALSIYAETGGIGLPDVPRLKGDMADLVVAERYLDRDHDLRSAAVYVRSAFESRLKGLCQRQGVAVAYNSNPNHVKADALWNALVARHNDRVSHEHKRLLDDALIPRINAVRSAVLNRLSHAGVPALTEPDVRAAIATIRSFQSTTVPFDP